MRKCKRICLIAIFVFSFSVFANAQDIPYYLFLETVDFRGQPVQGATVSFPSSNWRDKREKESWGWEAQTNENGKVRAFAQNHWDEFARPGFMVSKSGYYPFVDLGTLLKPFDNNYKLELLKIPQTGEEQKAIGREQSKREFFWAARDGDAAKVRGLIKSGISPKLNTDDLRGVSSPKNVPAIMFAAASGDAETVEIFLKAKVNVRKVENSEHSLLGYYLAARPKPYWNRSFETKEEKAKVLNDFERGVKSLLKAGARFENLDKDNANALMLSARYGYAAIAEFFLERGLKINAGDKSGQTALYYVNPYQNENLLEFLLKARADPNIIPNKNCVSLLMQAVSDGNTELVKLLIKYKADVNYACPNGKTIINFANRSEIKKLLQEAGAK